MNEETKKSGVFKPLKGWIRESETSWSYHGLGDWNDIHVIYDREKNKWVAMQGDYNMFRDSRIYKTKNEAINAAEKTVGFLDNDGLYELSIE